MVLFLAGLQNIDTNLYDAAEIDGAGSWLKFINVTIPGLRNIFTFVLSVALINGLRGFATVYIMTRGGPGYSTYLVAIYGYIKAFQEMHMGQAMVSSLVIGIIIILITIIFNIIRDKVLDY
jgi:raffinose/stachyose/melibiose transport system permease protein